MRDRHGGRRSDTRFFGMEHEIDRIPVGVSQQRAHASITAAEGRFFECETLYAGLPGDGFYVSAAKIRQNLGNMPLMEPGAAIAVFQHDGTKARGK